MNNSPTNQDNPAPQDPPVELTVRERLELAEEQIPLFRSLVKSLGWVQLVKVMQAQAQHRDNLIRWSVAEIIRNEQSGTQPIIYDGMGASLKREFEAGIRAGILLTLDFPRAQIAALVDEREGLRESLEDEQDAAGVAH